MKRTVHMIPVGHTKETIVDSMKIIGSMRQFPISKVIFILGDDSDLESEKRARHIASMVAGEFKKSFGKVPFENVSVSLDDVSSAAVELIKIIKREKSGGSEVILNLSASLRTIDLAGYIAALFTSVPVYVGIPSYDGEEVVGVRKVLEIPLVPIENLGKEKLEIFKLIARGEKSFNGIIGGVRRFSKSNNKDFSEKSRVSYHIKHLRESGLVKADRNGRSIRLGLSDLGKIYFEGMEEAKND